jgi:ribosomal-protein-alanine N-acetyltransferase
MRVMTVLDVDAVLTIEQEVQPYPWSRGNFCDALESGYLCYVYVSGEVLLGFAVLMTGVNEAELLNIAVLSGQQGKGWGRAMLEAMLEVAAIRQLSRVFLEVRASNAPAIALYRRTGFSQIGLRRDYYRNEKGSEDALVMACDLSGKKNG